MPLRVQLRIRIDIGLGDLVPNLEKIISGGQVGVDRAALDVALDLGLEIGGWCPAGRRAKWEPIPVRYPLQETPDWRYQQRTEWNVRDADATILVYRHLSPGTKMTKRLTKKHNKPCYEFCPNIVNGTLWTTEMVLDELRVFKTINVAGTSGDSPQGSRKIYEWASDVLRNLLSRLLDMPVVEPLPSFWA